MKIIFYCFIILLLSSCGTRNSKNPNVEKIDSETASETVKSGHLNIYISSKNNYFLYFKIGLFDIWLIDEEGGLVKFKPQDSLDSFAVDLSGTENKSQLLMRAQVPDGKYQGVLLTLDFSSSWTQVFTADKNKIIRPYLFNSLAHQIDLEIFHSQMAVMLDESEHITVEPDTDAQLSLLLDIDASMRFMPIDEEDETFEYLVTPIFDIKTGLFYPDNVIIEGILHSYNGEYIELTTQASKALEQSTLKIKISGTQQYTLNHLSSNLTNVNDRLLAFDPEKDIVYIQAQGTLQNNEFKLQALSVDESPNADNALLNGFLFKDRFIGRRIDLNSTQEAESYFFAGPVTVDNQKPEASTEHDFLNNVNALAVIGDITTINNTLPTNTTLSGTITAVNDKQIALDILSIEGINANLILGDSNNLSVNYSEALPGFTALGESIKMEGIFNPPAGYEADTLQDLNKQTHRYKLSMPLINNTPVLTFSDNNLNLSKEALEQAITSLVILADTIEIPIESFPVNNIDIQNSRFILLTERVKPFSNINSYTNKELFINNIQERQKDGFLVNAIAADGQWKAESFQANLVIVTMFGATELDDLSGFIEEDNNTQALSEPILKGIFQFHPSNKRNKDHHNTKNNTAFEYQNIERNDGRTSRKNIPVAQAHFLNKKETKKFILKYFNKIDNVSGRLAKNKASDLNNDAEYAHIVSDIKKQLPEEHLYNTLDLDFDASDELIGRRYTDMLDKHIGDSGKSALLILGIDTYANDKEISQAYRDLIRKHHPDKNRDNIEAATTKTLEIYAAHDHLNKIRHAFNVLSSDIEKENYDKAFTEKHISSKDILTVTTDSTPEDIDNEYEKVKLTYEGNKNFLDTAYTELRQRAVALSERRIQIAHIVDLNKARDSIHALRDLTNSFIENKRRTVTLDKNNIKIINKKLNTYIKLKDDAEKNAKKSGVYQQEISDNLKDVRKDIDEIRKNIMQTTNQEAHTKNMPTGKRKIFSPRNFRFGR